MSDPLPGRVRVVVADDSSEVRFLVVSTLDRDHRIEVVAEAANGNEAVEAALRLVPDCLVVDLFMPGSDGFAVIRSLRTTHPELTIVVLTGEESDTALDLAAELGADAVLSKPDTFDRLVPVMIRAVRGRRQRDLLI